VRPTQGKTLAVMPVSGGSQSFNAVNQMRVLGRRMRMITIPNQSVQREKGNRAGALEARESTGDMTATAGLPGGTRTPRCKPRQHWRSSI